MVDTTTIRIFTFGIFWSLFGQVLSQLPKEESSFSSDSNSSLFNTTTYADYNVSVPTNSNSSEYLMWRHTYNLTLLFFTIASCIFLCLTIATYLVFPSLLNVHGKTILCHLVCLLATFVLQMVEDFILPDIRTTKPTYYGHFCWIVGFLMYFFTLSSNFWLTIVNFDIWNTCARNGGTNKFSTYCVLALGIPVLLCITVFTLEFSLPGENDFKPSFATTRCFLPLFPTRSILLYFYLVVGILLVFNFSIFTWTSATLCSIQSTTARVKKDSKSKQILQRCMLFFKLFCVMGTTWTINVTLWLLNVHKLSPEDKTGLVRFFEIFNVSHGFCYFIVFCCKPSILRMYKERFSESFVWKSSQTYNSTGCNSKSNGKTGLLMT